MWSFKRKQTTFDGAEYAEYGYGETGMYPDPVTAGVWHHSYQHSAFVVSLGSTGFGLPDDPFVALMRSDKKPDWWRCDGCGHAVPWHKDGQPQVVCPHCGGQLPTRYDK